MRAPENVNDEDILRAFDALLEPKRARMSLAVFTKKFLPFLSTVPIPKEKVDQMLETMSRRINSNYRPTPKELHINLMNEWMDAVVSPFFEVEVFDADGNIVYIVPPILDNTTTISDRSESIPNLVEQAANQTKVYPRLGEEYINNHIIPLLNHAAMRPEYVDMWNKIYKYHGLPLIQEKKAVDSETDEVTPTVNDTNTVESFDDFGD